MLLYRAPAVASSRASGSRRSAKPTTASRSRGAICELRGPGELLGTRQTGLAQLRVADLMRDADLLPRVQEAAELILCPIPEISHRSPRAGSAAVNATEESASKHRS